VAALLAPPGASPGVPNGRELQGSAPYIALAPSLHVTGLKTGGLLLMWSTGRGGTTFVAWAGTGITPEAAVAERPPAALLPVSPAEEIAALRLTSW
jgi:hypothetical protein